MSDRNGPMDFLSEALLSAARAQGDPGRYFDSAASGAAAMVVFGCGQLGRTSAQMARHAGLRVVAFADNNPAKQGVTVDGLPVLSPAEAVARYNADAVFVIGVFNSGAPLRQLRDLGAKRAVTFAAFYLRYPASFPGEPWFDLPRQILDRADAIREGYDCLAGDDSRREFAAQIEWRCTLDYSCLPPARPSVDTYFEPGLVRLLPDEVFTDCGAFSGDSIQAFLARNHGACRQVYAVEPDPRNREALESNLRPVLGGKLAVLPYGVGKDNRTVSFEVTGTAGSHITDSGSVTIDCRRLDDLLTGLPPTFIKMDIEGAEPDAIEGAFATIRSARPVMAVCAYHKCDHLWRIPALLKQALPDYEIHLRRYAEECWELVYYAIPPERRS